MNGAQETPLFQEIDVLFRARGDNGKTFGSIRNLSNNAGMSFDSMIM